MSSDTKNNSKNGIGEVSMLKETSKGYYLYINGIKQKLIIKKGKIINDLTKHQMKFVKDYANIRK